jgi:hypothetical protein
MLRDRREDLGCLMILLGQLLEHPCWDNLEELKSFSIHSEESKEDIITALSFAFESLREKIVECLEIAKGKD